jgi:hypothetical protein
MVWIQNDQIVPKFSMQAIEEVVLIQAKVCYVAV